MGEKIRLVGVPFTSRQIPPPPPALHVERVMSERVSVDDALIGKYNAPPLTFAVHPVKERVENER